MTAADRPSAVAATIHRRWVEAAGTRAGTVDTVAAAIGTALATSRSGTWQVGEAVAQFAALALVERSDDLAGIVDWRDARLPVVELVLHDIPVDLRVSQEAVDAAVLAAARVLLGVDRG